MIRSGAEILRQALDEQAHKQETLELEQRLEAAAAQPGLSGELRRALRAAKVWPDVVAHDCGIDAKRFRAFLADEDSLPSAELDRLAVRLGLHLVPVGAE